MRTIQRISSALFLLALVIFTSGQAIAQSGTWTTKAPMPTARSGAGVGVIGGKLYVASGCCTSPSYPQPRLHNLEVYDPATDIWTTKAPIPLAVELVATGVISDKLYLAGGVASQTEGNFVATLQVYDPTSDTWTTKAPMPEPLEGAAAGVINGQLYVAGGYDNGSERNALRVYNPVSDTWTTKAPMPTTRFLLSGGVISGILYAVGGQTGSSALATLEAYDPATDTWTTKAPMPTARTGLAVGVVYGILYAVGGSNAINGVTFNTVEAYDPVTNTWTTKASMPTARYMFGAGTLNNTLYAVGGINQTGGWPPIPTNEAFTPTPPLPTTAGQCKDGGWQTFGVFKNQGDCVSSVATAGKNPFGKIGDK